ncbi:hypothetical protein Tco_1205081 [Tanacetum coccineum]
MELCTNLQQRVLNLEKTKTSQQNEIASEDASKHRRINAIDADDDITLVSIHDDVLDGEEVVVKEDTIKDVA